MLWAEHRWKTWSRFFVGIGTLSLFSLTVLAKEASSSGTWLQVLNPQDSVFEEPVEVFPIIGSTLSQESWKWSLSPSRADTYSSGCDPDQDLFWRPGDQFPEARVRSCLKEWEQVDFLGLRSLIKTVGLAYPTQNIPPEFRRVLIHFPGGVQLKGLLLLRDQKQTRPLVIMRPGIFSNVQEFYPERFLAMMHFDQAHSNILILESLSGFQFAKRNHTYFFGGLEEGLQNFWILQQLGKKDTLLGRLTSEVHALGISLSGLGMAFATRLAEENPTAIPMRSLQMFCPLVDFKSTFEKHQEKPWQFLIQGWWNRDRLSRLRESVPEIIDADFLTAVLEYLNRTYQQSGASIGGNDLKLWKWPKEWEFFGSEGTASFFSQAQNSLASLRVLRTPTLVWSSRNDPMVWYGMNGEKVAALKNPHLHFFPLDQSIHCAMVGAYDWRAFSRVSSAWTQVHSGHKMQFQTRWLTKQSGLSIKNSNATEFASYHLELKPEAAKWIFSGTYLEVPWADLGFPPLSLEQSEGLDFERSRRERWLQMNSRIINGTRGWTLEWRQIGPAAQASQSEKLPEQGKKHEK